METDLGCAAFLPVCPMLVKSAEPSWLYAKRKLGPPVNPDSGLELVPLNTTGTGVGAALVDCMILNLITADVLTVVSMVTLLTS